MQNMNPICSHSETCSLMARGFGMSVKILHPTFHGVFKDHLAMLSKTTTGVQHIITWNIKWYHINTWVWYKMYTRRFKVTFVSPSWRSLNPFKGSRFHHPKKVTKNCQAHFVSTWFWGFYSTPSEHTPRTKPLPKVCKGIPGRYYWKGGQLKGYQMSV